jgi:coenzyme F420-reducing hydrogenase beta subunit
MHPDSEGFLYPQIDPKECIHCGACLAACPAQKEWPIPTSFPGNHPTPPCYAARVNDNSILKNSSSGGLFSLFSQYAVKNGYAVAGVRWNSDFSAAQFDLARTPEVLPQFMGSKYLQADTAGIYKRIKQCLKSGEGVLFFGTACQITALYQFLKDRPESLTTIEIICHGVPSPMLWNLHLKTTQAKMGIEAFTKIEFRNKSHGWEKYCLLFEGTKDGSPVAQLEPFTQDTYFRLFLKNLSLRPACYHCKYKKQRCGADLTIGDFWKVSKYLRKFNDDTGLSCCCVNTKKGEKLLSATKDDGFFHACKYSWVLSGNPSLEKPVPVNDQRKTFFDALLASDTPEAIMEDFASGPLHPRPERKTLLTRISRLLDALRGCFATN